MKSSLLALVILLIAHANAQAMNCSTAIQNQCGVGACANFHFVAGRCVQQMVACSDTQFFLNSTNACSSCLSLDAASCTASCAAFRFFTGASTSYTTSGVVNGCSHCEDAFGLGCRSCSTTACTSCDSSSTLNATTNKCIGNSCSQLQNCQQCASALTCRLCLQGYDLNLATFTCAIAASGCKVKHCIACQSAATCMTCFAGYKLSSDQAKCGPQCTNAHCASCVRPGVCGACAAGYILNPSTSTCHLNCATNAVANCHACVNMHSCTTCSQGYHLAFEGARCYADCTVQNCIICSPASTCSFCATGFTQTNGACVQDVCRIQNCDTCNSSSTCETCFNSFVPNGDKTACVSNCSSNCLLCPGSSSTCESCLPGYGFIMNPSSNISSCLKFCTIASCSICASASLCSQCDANHGLSADAASCKLMCVDNCDICATATSCTACNSGFNVVGNNCVPACLSFQILIGSTCQSCKTNDGNCNTCINHNSAVRCASCVDGFYLASTFRCSACSTLMANCMLCSGGNSFQCRQCASPNKLTTAGTCVICAPIPNCENCMANDTTKCATCTVGFQLGNNTCTLIQRICPNSTKLIAGVCACASGAYLSGTTCLPCKANCVRCSSSACFECVSRFFPSGQTCSPCESSCLACSSAVLCTDCTAESNLIDGSCIPSGDDKAIVTASGAIECSFGCQSCFLNTTTNANGQLVDTVICRQVEEGYVLVLGEPVRCNSTCLTCSNSDPNICTSCQIGFALQNGQNCIFCQDLAALTCSPTNSLFSTSCARIFTLNALLGVCQACPAYCIKCDIAPKGKCDPDSCDSGYVLDESQSCVNCFNNCPHCDANDPGICVSCDTNSFLDNGTCLACPDNCRTCTSLTVCTQCFPTFIVLQQNSSKLCFGSPVFPCAEINAALACSKCFTGFTLNNNACVFNASCTSSADCPTCQGSNFLSAGTCLPCTMPAGCRRCKGVQVNNCQRCQNGFYLNNRTCSACRSGCLKCRNPIFCTQAAYGSYITLNHKKELSGTTDACKSPCQSCHINSYNCLSCVEGFRIFGARCFSRRLVKCNAVFTPNNPNLKKTGVNETDINKSKRNTYTLKRVICASLPALLTIDDDEICSSSLILESVSLGSLDTNFIVDSHKIGVGPQAQALVLDSINTKGIDGSIVKKVSSSGTQGYSQSGSSSLNLGLIIGVSVPLGLLFILIIIFTIYYNKGENREEYQKDIFYQQVNQQQHI